MLWLSSTGGWNNVDYIWAFIVGGALCVLAQLVLDLTQLTQAHVMVLFVSLGAVVSGIGWYKPLVELGGAGATIPLPGFGHALVEGITKEVGKLGLMGLFSGGLTATSLGLTVAIVAGYAIALLFNPKG